MPMTPPLPHTLRRGAIREPLDDAEMPPPCAAEMFSSTESPIAEPTIRRQHLSTADTSHTPNTFSRARAATHRRAAELPPSDAADCRDTPRRSGTMPAAATRHYAENSHGHRRIRRQSRQPIRPAYAIADATLRIGRLMPFTLRRCRCLLAARACIAAMTLRHATFTAATLLRRCLLMLPRLLPHASRCFADTLSVRYHIQRCRHDIYLLQSLRHV